MEREQPQQRASVQQPMQLEPMDVELGQVLYSMELHLGNGGKQQLLVQEGRMAAMHATRRCWTTPGRRYRSAGACFHMYVYYVLD